MFFNEMARKPTTVIISSKLYNNNNNDDFYHFPKLSNYHKYMFAKSSSIIVSVFFVK